MKDPEAVKNHVDAQNHAIRIVSVQVKQDHHPLLLAAVIRKNLTAKKTKSKDVMHKITMKIEYLLENEIQYL